MYMYMYVMYMSFEFRVHIGGMHLILNSHAQTSKECRRKGQHVVCSHHAHMDIHTYNIIYTHPECVCDVDSCDSNKLAATIWCDGKSVDIPFVPPASLVEGSRRCPYFVSPLNEINLQLTPDSELSFVVATLDKLD